MRSLNSVVLVALVGCADSPVALPTTLQIEPAAVTVTVVDGHVVTTPYTATVIDDDGSARDVTAQTTFGIATAFGSFSGPTLSVTGAALGPTEVVAKFEDLTADAAITVYSRATYGDGAALFSAPRDPSCAPAITYPTRNTIVPRGLPSFEVHWADASDDIFELALKTTYLDVRVYTRGADADTPFWTLVPAWDRLTAEREPIELVVTGTTEADPQSVCTSSTQRVYVANEALVGGVYWSSPVGVMRYDVAHEVTAPLLPAASSVGVISAGDPIRCVGCSITSDGSRIAVPGPSSVIYDIATHALVDTARTWDAASFDPIGSKLVIENTGTLELITAGGDSLATISDDGVATDPQLSPDGTQLANIETFTNGDAIVVRSFDNATNTFGDARTLVAADATHASPAWSPDGKWLAFTRTIGDVSSIWVVAADGSQPPIQVTLPGADYTARARWVPGSYTFGPSRFFFLTFDSTQSFGQRARGTSQLWMLPFFPATGTTAPALRMPMQDITDNYVVQWTANVVAM